MGEREERVEGNITNFSLKSVKNRARKKSSKKNEYKGINRVQNTKDTRIGCGASLSEKNPR